MLYIQTFPNNNQDLLHLHRKKKVYFYNIFYVFSVIYTNTVTSSNKKIYFDLLCVFTQKKKCFYIFLYSFFYNFIIFYNILHIFTRIYTNISRYFSKNSQIWARTIRICHIFIERKVYFDFLPRKKMFLYFYILFFTIL